MGCYTDICEEWNDEPTTPKGQCTPRRLKSDCGLTAVYANEPQTVTLECPEGSITDPVSCTVEAGEVSSPFSVAAANATALAQAQACAEALRAASPCLYVNSEQTCEDVCPEGTEGETISVTIPAGSFTRESQEEADAAALAEACAQVEELRALSPCVEPEPEEEPGSLWGWGYNFRSILGTGDAATRYTPTIVGDASVVEWLMVRGGGNYSVGIKEDGTLWSWGSNAEGQLGNGLRSIHPSTANDHYIPEQVGSATNWVWVAAGNQFVMAINSLGELWGWGANDAGQLGLGDTTRRLVPTLIDVGPWSRAACSHWGSLSSHSIAIKDDGTLWATGSNGVGQLGLGDTTQRTTFTQVGSDSWLAADCAERESAGIKADGSVWWWGEGFLDPSQDGLTTDTGFVELSYGAGFVMFLDSTGTLYGAGSNTWGQLGKGTLDGGAISDPVLGGAVWVKHFCTLGHTLALKNDGTIWGWGLNNNAQLGQGSVSAAEPTPIQIGPDELWTDIGVHESGSFGMRSVATAPPPPAGTSGVALGGVLSIVGGYHIHTFDASQDFEVLDGAGVLFDILIIGGAGGGGGLGGGGCGEFVKQTGVSLSDGTYPVVVGARGFYGGGGTPGTNGTSSSFNGTTALGGGGGAGRFTLADSAGRNGAGGGGGGVNDDDSLDGVGGTGSPEGNGGNGSWTSIIGYSGGGGGGASANGANSTSGASSGTGGNGGNGTSDSITGTAVTYCAGGAGGGVTAGGTGGSGGIGGAGGRLAGPGGGWATTPGSGGGGGGGHADVPGGQGGRGTVIIAYLSPP